MRRFWVGWNRLSQQRYSIKRLNHLGGFRTSELWANGSWIQKGLSHLTSTTTTNRIIKPERSLPENSNPRKQRKDRGMADYSREQRSMNLKGLNDPSAQSEQPCHLRILSYNLWFREDVAIVARMKAIGDIIHSYGLPDILCFQEVTRLIYSILSRSDWWSNYDVRPAPDDISNLSYFTAILWRKSRLHPNFAAIPFENSIMGRDLKALVFPICGTRFCVATSHLESPTGKNSLYSASRRAQCAKATEVLDSIASNVVFIGDMNWTEANDGEPPLPQGWVDAWSVLYPSLSDGDGYTYDADRNAMLRRGRTRYRSRLDRAFCKLDCEWALEEVWLVGTDPIQGEVHNGLPVLPSDHFGLLLQVKRNEIVDLT